VVPAAGKLACRRNSISSLFLQAKSGSDFLKMIVKKKKKKNKKYATKQYVACLGYLLSSPLQEKVC
jgi:hypothetical protein